MASVSPPFPLQHSMEEPLLRQPTSEEATTSLSIDEILKQWVGEFGKAQLLHFTLVSLAWTVEALHTLVTIFADHTPTWTCTSSSSSSCTPTSSICSLEADQWRWVGEKSQSSVSEWGLVCQESYKVGLVQCLFFVGSLIGAGVFGNLSDSMVGRKGALAIVCILSFSFGFLTSFSPNYWVYLLLRTLTGVTTGAIGLCSFVLATEPVGPTMRGSVGMCAFYFFTLGIMLLSGLAYLTSSSWRTLYAITSLPGALYCLLVIPWLLESPRWYLVRGRYDDALRVLKTIASINGRFLPKEITLALDQEEEEESPKTNFTNIYGRLLPKESSLELDREEEESHKTSFTDINGRLLPKEISLALDQEEERPKTNSRVASGTLIDVFKTPSTCRYMLIMVLVWFSCALVYYGISLNVVNIGANLYVSVFLNAIAEIPAFAITAVLLARFGRRFILVLTMSLSGFACFVAVLFSTTDSLQHIASTGRLVCGVVGIFGMAGSYNLLYIYTTELFPTVVRNAALGLATQASHVGAIVAPFSALLGGIHQSIPFTVFSVVAMAGSLVSLGLPETLNKPMYETMEGLQRGETKGTNTFPVS